MYRMVDFNTRETVKPQDFVFSGTASPWEVVMDMVAVKQHISLDYFKTATPCLAKYLPLMPIAEPANFVSLRESATPLLASKRLGEKLGIDLYFKVEGKNPTGSFKDRGSAVDISVARELGAKGIVLASTGNMAASCSCYAAAANMPCYVFVPEDVPVAKLAQVMSYGGHIVKVKGTYNDAASLAEQVARERDLYLAGDYAFRVEGQKAALFEVIDQLLYRVPDKVFLPIGCGTNMAAYYKGLQDYQALGLIDRFPQLMGVQANGANAVVAAFAAGESCITPLSAVETMATAIAVPDPLDGQKALQAIYQTQGAALAVSDSEILQAQYLLSTEEGLFVESAGAATLAALLKYVADNACQGQQMICVLTGEGLKDPSVVLKKAIQPATIYPTVKEFTRLVEGGVFNRKTMIFSDQNQVLFSTVPDKGALAQALMTGFNVQADDALLETVMAQVSSFLKKGKRITVSNLQDILQDAQEVLLAVAERPFQVIDFNVTTGKDQIPLGTVMVLNQGQELTATSAGVGPVDAVVNALCQACQGDIDFKLIDYRVVIRSAGVDAVVHAEMKLQQNNQTSQGAATSPDIIQASIAAFERAYNGFLGRAA